ncbi:hypothetical protein LX36DRAFT_715150 [Colletotrichum falcatum]|nr:hypothetical protein LX36DRAFT_715150 [Colletotrichum falcatum]
MEYKSDLCKIYNALTGLGGSGQLSRPCSSLAITILALVGPKIVFLVGGWTYALYSGSLLNFDYSANGTLVIAAGAILGIGSSLIWIVQGAIMTIYVHES